MYRGINDLKKGYRPITNIEKDDSDLVADSHSNLAKWMNFFSQLLNVHGVNDVRQTEIHTAEPFVSEPSSSETELAIEKLQNHNSPDIDQIQAELIKVGGNDNFLCDL